LITIYPEDVRFLSMKLSADPDVIDPDINEDESPGFTYVEILVEDEKGDPASGVMVVAEVSPAIPSIGPESALSDADGRASFKLTATDLPEDNGDVVEYSVIARAYDPNDDEVKNATGTLSVFIVDAPPSIIIRDNYWLRDVAIAATAILAVGAIMFVYIRRRGK
ncbi:MAG: hypothetical protein KAX31_03935, partial [Thermoplasmata archaeon]|nr:hypothetical protein [Thermoplasmata archaeon]